MILFNSSGSSNVIDFLGIKIPITTFLLITAGIALLIFLVLLVILLLMYLRKKLEIKGYLAFNKKPSYLEDGILEIEGEILQVQKKFYLNQQIKKTKKIFH